MRLPGFNAETSLGKASNLIAAAAREQPNLGVGVLSAGSDTFNCNCGSGGSGGTGGSGNPPPPPGVCNCSSVLGVGCSVSANHCNTGFVPRCDCGVFGNSCQCVPGN